MSAETPVVVHAEMSVEPEPIIAPDAIQPVPADAWRRGREFAVYRVPSRSLGTDRTVVWNDKTRAIYCDCEAAQFGKVCAHVKSVLWKVAYEQAYRLYADLSLPELQERQRDYIEIERGAKAEARAWRAINAAVGELVRERTEDAA